MVRQPHMLSKIMTGCIEGAKTNPGAILGGCCNIDPLQTNTILRSKQQDSEHCDSDMLINTGNDSIHSFVVVKCLYLYDEFQAAVFDDVPRQLCA